MRNWYTATYAPAPQDALHVEVTALTGVFGSVFGKYPGLGFPVLLLLVAGFFYKSPQSSRFQTGVLLGVVVMTVVAYLHPDLRAVKVQATEDIARFLLPAMPCFLALVIPKRESRFYGSFFLLLVAWQLAGALFRITRGWGHHEPLLIGAHVFVVWLALRSCRLQQLKAQWSLAVAGIALGCMLPTKQLYRAYYIVESHAHSNVPRDWAPLVPLVDEPLNPQRIAITCGHKASVDNFIPYYFLGSRLQNTVT